MINGSERHHRNPVTADVQVSTDVGGSLRGSFPSIISLRFTVTTKLVLFLTSLYTEGSRSLGLKGVESQ